MKIKVHAQLEPYTGTKFDFIEVEVDKVAQIPQVYKALEALKGEVKAPAKQVADHVTPNANQLRLVKQLGGDVNKVFKTWDEFSKYVDELKAKKPSGIKAAPAKDTTKVETQDTPWELDL